MPNPTPIQRSTGYSDNEVTFSTSLNDSTAVSFAPFSLLAFFAPAGATGTVTWYGSHTVGGPYYPVTLSDGTAAQTGSIQANTFFVAPPELFAFPFLKGVASGSTFVGRVLCKG